MSDLDQLRKKIDRLRSDLARSQGEQKGLEASLAKTMTEIREKLGCESGEEKGAIKALRSKIEKDRKSLASILEEVDKIREGRDDG